uniref:Uncharacterized protein n=1 Tax=Oryza meridionalis TaxID=40149 RepID=A0A0E0CN03_9ORYZ
MFAGGGFGGDAWAQWFIDPFPAFQRQRGNRSINLCIQFSPFRLRPMLVHRQVPRFSVLLGEVKWICRLVAGNIDLNLIHINYMLGAC